MVRTTTVSPSPLRIEAREHLLELGSPGAECREVIPMGRVSPLEHGDRHSLAAVHAPAQPRVAECERVDVGGELLGTFPAYIAARVLDPVVHGLVELRLELCQLGFEQPAVASEQDEPVRLRRRRARIGQPQFDRSVRVDFLA